MEDMKSGSKKEEKCYQEKERRIVEKGMKNEWHFQEKDKQ